MILNQGFSWIAPRYSPLTLSRCRRRDSSRILPVVGQALHGVCVDKGAVQGGVLHANPACVELRQLRRVRTAIPTSPVMQLFHRRIGRWN